MSNGYYVYLIDMYCIRMGKQEILLDIVIILWHYIPNLTPFIDEE